MKEHELEIFYLYYQKSDSFDLIGKVTIDIENTV